ncbi:MAG TPA: coniferyl aldehyde dehydrogenase [Pseudolabrys sp.]|nr:coniferyl aldehyde dehydrogenase [Pseudolabrys sp.]
MDWPADTEPDAVQRMETSFHALRAASRQDIDVPLALRRDRLKRLCTLLNRHCSDFEAAISDDFGHRSAHETRFAETVTVEAAIKHALRHVARWMKDRRVPTDLHFRPGSNRLLPQPLGVVGVIAPWNYPLMLSLSPVVSALAAGNLVMIKPSERVPRFSACLNKAISEYFDATEVVVVEGGPEISERFAALPFDHLLFTGSTRVGRLVAASAAKNLTPVTLELGGKSPVIIDHSAELAAAARRIAFGKLLNAGQTCIAPDYVLCPANMQEQFVELFFGAVSTLYGSDPGNPDYTTIIDAADYERLQRLIDDGAAKGARIEHRVDKPEEWKLTRKLPPCLVLATSDDMLVRREEIFGPILPVIPYERAEQAIAFVNDRDRPLALYWFGTDRDARDRVIRETVSGGVTVNDCLTHIAQEHQPFGGVGASGSGSYHGEWGFRSFSKEKPIFYQSRLSWLELLLPPYGRVFDWTIRLLRLII